MIANEHLFSTDVELLDVAAELRRLDPDGARFATVIRSALDQLYDGQRTGRWRFADLHKTEKTHMGTLIEINLQREFDFADGDVTDYRIAGVQVDCKYSMKPGGWTLPPEVVGQLALVVTADDARSTWAAGLVRVSEDVLNPGRNRDAKATLSMAGKSGIHWLWPANGQLPENVFLTLTDDEISRIFEAKSAGRDTGQARVNELFRLVQGRPIRRAELATVAQQDDFMKRARGNGGARGYLRSEGIVILGHQHQDPVIAAALGLPRSKKGELLSVRLHPADPDDREVVEIDGACWRRALSTDEPVMAPAITRDSIVRARSDEPA